MAENRITPVPAVHTPPVLWSDWITQYAAPHRQLVAVLSVFGLAMLGYWQIQGASEHIWLLAFAGLFFYVCTNCLVGFFRRSGILVYTFWSWLFLGVLATALLSGASWLSGLGINDLPEYRTMLSAHLVFYIIATFLVAIMREVAKITGIEY